MMIQFWLGAILLLIIASAIFLIPFLSAKKAPKYSSHDNRNQLNRALYDVRIAELESDEQQGLLVDKDKIIAELQHNLLDDIDDHSSAGTTKKSKYLWLPGLLLLTVGSVVMYWSVGAYHKVDDWQQALQRYPALQGKLFNGDNNLTDKDLRDIMLGLRTHLASEPNDADGWLLYSRLGMVFKDTALAQAAIEKAYVLNPTSVDVVLIYAQLKMQGDEYEQQQAELMLQQLLIENPSEIDAWSMFAFMALERQDYVAAIKRWQMMLTLPSVSVEQADMLRGSIDYAKQQLAMQPASNTEALSEPQAIKAVVQQDQTTFDEAGMPIYRINISVADHVIVPERGFVIVYAQAAVAPKMPISAVKFAFTELPVSVQLGDANSMIEGVKLSDQAEFIIKARLSKTGDVMNIQGDWQGASQVIKTDQKTAINIMISEQL